LNIETDPAAVRDVEQFGYSTFSYPSLSDFLRLRATGNGIHSININGTYLDILFEGVKAI
jgi:hypothetical protein